VRDRSVYRHSQKLDHTQEQQMQRVKGVVCILQYFVMVALLAMIQPDRNERQQGDALPWHKMCLPPHGDLIRKAAQHLQVDISQTDKLSQVTPPRVMSEKVEHQDSDDTGMIKIDKGSDSADIPDAHGDDPDQDAEPSLFFLYFLIPSDQPDGDQKTPQHILMYRVDQTAPHCQIERNLGDHGKQEQSSYIFL